MSNIYCQSCGSPSKYGSSSCGSCGEPFNKVKEPSRSSAETQASRTFDPERAERENEFDFSCFAEEIEREIKNNSDQALNRTITGRDLFSK